MFTVLASLFYRNTFNQEEALSSLARLGTGATLASKTMSPTPMVSLETGNDLLKNTLSLGLINIMDHFIIV